MTASEALEIINSLLQPSRLSYVEELVFQRAWSGQLYREIARDAGYDYSYIKEVGAQVWTTLSDRLGQRVTKKNVRLILEDFRQAREQSPIQLMSGIQSPSFPSGLVPFHSSLYLDRPPIEEQVYAELAKPGSLIRIKAPRQMGKSSLMYKALSYANHLGYRTAVINLQWADSRLLSNLNSFLRWFCLNVSRQLRLTPRLEDYWDEEIGAKMSCTTYFQDYLLQQIDGPVVLALDEMQRIFSLPEIAQDFLPLLRSWHEEASVMEEWRNLRLIVVHSTEVYVPLNVSQSPFNVGLPLELPEFTVSQMQRLVEGYGLSNVADTDLQKLSDVIGGHPYLLQLALYWLRQSHLTLPHLMTEAATLSGIYSQHLRQLLELLQHHPTLQRGFLQVLSSHQPVQLEAIAAYQLASAGLVKLNGNLVTVSRELYRDYFSRELALPLSSIATALPPSNPLEASFPVIQPRSWP